MAILRFHYCELPLTVDLLIYCRVCLHTHVISGDVRSGVADGDPQNSWNPRENCGFFVDATSSEP